jgi:leader peptidase (prepilin peptidase) / N-methyltransferase
MAAAAAIGLCVGSFLNVVIHRLPRMMEAQWRAECAAIEGREAPPAERFNLVTPASHCPSCGTPIRPWHNVPVFGWLWLRGKCAHCKAPISARYPLVELLGGLLAALAAWRFGASAPLVGALVYCWALIALTFIDFDTQLLPDDITLPLLWLGLALNVFGFYSDLRSAVLGAIAGYLVLWTVYWVFRLVTHKEGMGYGDFKLLAAIGAWVGWQVLPFVIVVSAGIGAVLGSIALAVTRKGRDTQIPFGPYLALGGIAGLVWGREAVIAWLGRFPA